jgi:uncharacterized protein YkwD
MAATPTVTAQDSAEPTLIQRMNEVREARGLNRLRSSLKLTRAATRHANSLAGAGYFKHDLYTPKKSPNWWRFGSWVNWYWPGPGYRYWYAGENLAWGSPELSPRTAVRWWLNSPSHRANLLSSTFRRVGVAVVHVENPGGYYADYDDVTIVVAEYGSRS